MSDFSKMSQAEKDALVANVADVVKKHGLESKLKIQVTRETVCALAANEIEDSQTLSLEKSFPEEMKDTIDAFQADIKPVVEGIKNVEVKVQCAIGVGSTYKPLKDIVPIKGGDPITLEHKAGEVWLIDFWATWCPPCQAPMQHNEDMLKKRAADWGDKVKIIGVSIDKEAATVVSHVEKKDWNRPIHYHRASSDCSQVYQVRGVPHVMLIDTNGKIVFKGHPATRPDLEADFDTLLKGEAITGAGTDAPKAEEPKEGEAGKPLDIEATH